MMSAVPIYYLIFGILTIAGGTLGYLKAKSRLSLGIGGGVGLVLIGSAVAIYLGRTNAGLIIGLLASAALAGQFIPKVAMGRAPIHAIIMAVLSAISLILTIIAFTEK